METTKLCESLLDVPVTVMLYVPAGVVPGVPPVVPAATLLLHPAITPPDIPSTATNPMAATQVYTLRRSDTGVDRTLSIQVEVANNASAKTATKSSIPRGPTLHTLPGSKKDFGAAVVETVILKFADVAGVTDIGAEGKVQVAPVGAPLQDIVTAIESVVAAPPTAESCRLKFAVVPAVTVAVEVPPAGTAI